MTQPFMVRNKFLLAASLLGVLLGVLPMRLLSAQTAMEQLKANFKNPPDDTRPMMRWWWFGLAVEKPEIRRELEQMKQMASVERSSRSFIPRWSTIQRNTW